MKIEISENTKLIAIALIVNILPLTGQIKKIIPYNGLVDYVIGIIIFITAVIGLKSVNTSTKILCIYIIYLLALIEIIIAILSRWWHVWVTFF
jgi:hypothetical protein